MKFLLDEDLSPKLTVLLQNLGYPATHIREIQISLEDSQILEIAVSSQFIVITEDRDFGELVFKKGQAHTGVIFLRLEDQTLVNTQRVVKWLLSNYKDKIEDSFTTVTEKDGKLKVRFRKKRRKQ